MALRPVSRSITALGILALIGAGLSALAAPTSAVPAPAPPAWPANNSEVPAGVFGIQIVLSGGMGGGNYVACQVTSSQRVQPGNSVSWILGADGVGGTVSQFGSVEAGGAGGLGAYGFSGAAGGNSSAFIGANSGGGGGGASAFEVNGVARIVVGGSGGSGAYVAGACQSDGTSGFVPDLLNGNGVALASSWSDVVAGGLVGSAPGQPGLPGAPGNPSTGAGAGEGGIGGNDNASTFNMGGGGGGGGGFAGGGGGVGASIGNTAGYGSGGGNMVEPSPYMAAPVFEAGASQQAVINWVHVSGATLTAARAGVPYRATPTATFGSATATTPLAADTNAAWIVDGTGSPLPDGLQLNTTTGEISGKATTPGGYSFRLIAAQHEDGGMVAFSKATFNLTVLRAIEPQATRQRQSVRGVPLPSELTRTGGNVLLKRSTFTSSGQPVHVQVSVTPLLRARPAGDLKLYRMVTGANGSKTLYITTSQRVSVTVTLYAGSSRGYLKWTKARAYSL